MYDDDELIVDEDDENETENAPYNPESSAKEVNVDNFEFDCECPKCGFQFNGK